jgi:hypothetical protein
MYTTSCKYCLVSTQHSTETQGCLHSCVVAIARTRDEDVSSQAATLVPAVHGNHGNDATDSHAEYAMLHSEEVLLQKKSDE